MTTASHTGTSTVFMPRNLSRSSASSCRPARPGAAAGPDAVTTSRPVWPRQVRRAGSVGAEPEKRNVVEVGLADAVHLWCGDFDDEHLGEELDLCAKQVAGVADGAVFLQADRDVDVRCDTVVAWVVGEGAAAESFDIGQVDLGPHGCVRVVEL